MIQCNILRKNLNRKATVNITDRSLKRMHHGCVLGASKMFYGSMQSIGHHFQKIHGILFKTFIKMTA